MTNVLAETHGATRTRVAIREVHECAFRALVAAGASPGEATTAASQVTEAEVGHGSGLAGLVQHLEGHPWPRGDLRARRRVDGDWTTIHVTGDGNHSSLTLGALLADVAAAEAPERTLVVAAGLTDVCALLDHALLTAAATAQEPVGALTSAGDHLPARYRVATPDGAIGWGHLEDEPPQPLTRLGRGQTELALARPFPTTSNAIWLTADERSGRRRTAAAQGLWVDAHLWSHAYAHSRHYLVPEVPADPT